MRIRPSRRSDPPSPNGGSSFTRVGGTDPGGRLASGSVKTELFDYDLPAAAIGQTPVEPRDASRLLAVSTMADHGFTALPSLLSSGDLLVVNRTRVRAARLHGTKPATGGSVELLLTRRRDESCWEGLVRPARRIREGTRLDFGPIRGVVVAGPDRGVVEVKLEGDGGDVEDLLDRAGEVPLPPYITEPLEDSERYQTIFATTVGSAAAPTAALHFTPRLVGELQRGGIDVAEIELDVGLDTFRPIATERIEDHLMHRESFRVPITAANAIATAHRRGSRVIAVGSTAARTLETAADDRGGVVPGVGESGLFIAPGYRLRVIDGLITNFHAPRTTLIVMIAALVGPRWRSIYDTALARGYRFLSFGDAMLIDDPVNPR